MFRKQWGTASLIATFVLWGAFAGCRPVGWESSDQVAQGKVADRLTRATNVSRLEAESGCSNGCGHSCCATTATATGSGCASDESAQEVPLEEVSLMGTRAASCCDVESTVSTADITGFSHSESESRNAASRNPQPSDTKQEKETTQEAVTQEGEAQEQDGRKAGDQDTPASRMRHDQGVFQFLLTHHEKIQRTVKVLDNGVETVTESEDPEIIAKIQEHVAAMAHRVEEVQPIRMRDPLFREIFRNAKKIDMKWEKTEKGVRVLETSEDPYVVKLIQKHAQVVSGFVTRGFAEARENHTPPGK